MAAPTLADRLSNRTLGRLPAEVARPAYDRAALVPGIVHLGVGAFHRAHQAVYLDDRLAAGETGWAIAGASLRSPATRDALAPQDGLYTLAVRGPEGQRLRVVGSIVSLLVAPEDPARLLEVLADPRVRMVTLTVTEKAYLRTAAGALDADHADIRADLARPEAPRTAHGFLVEALARRRRAGVSPFTILSCDNLPANGATLHGLLVQFAGLRDPGLARHVADEVACPSSMVDRIVPATTEADRAAVSARLGVEDAWPVATEPFSQWVVEDRFPAGRPALEEAGVQMVRDVAPFELMKLRLLNGSHSAIAYLGLLAGHATVSDAFADPAIRRFVDGLWAEAAPTLPSGAGLDPADYTRRLAGRYANRALVHRTAQIANDGSQKLPQRIVSTAVERLEAGAPAERLALVVAAWIAAAEARGRALPAGLFSDPLDDRLGALASLAASEAAALAFDLAGLAAGSPQRPRLLRLVAGGLDRLRGRGVRPALAETTVS